ncbi:hypothetical protein H0R92_14015, partial [Treponema sp. OMZ 840]|uniref:hypothetical protein n=1 Tax=Treponema sp. OMZ 840 TaxID=244313 RepID=UPI003D8BB354
TPPVQQGGANIGTTPGGTQAGSGSGGAADTVGQSGNENAAPVQNPSLPNTGGVPSVPPVQNESDITQQAASAQNPVPQVPATAEKKKSEGLWSGL